MHEDGMKKSQFSTNISLYLTSYNSRRVGTRAGTYTCPIHRCKFQ